MPQHAREQLIEMVAEADEQLMETFFAEGTLTQEQLVSGLRSATMTGKLFPPCARQRRTPPACSRCSMRSSLHALTGRARFPHRR